MGGGQSQKKKIIPGKKLGKKNLPRDSVRKNSLAWKIGLQISIKKNFKRSSEK
jgi:hypothetical protein